MIEADKTPGPGDRPLEGIRVLDLTVALAGPYGSLLLGGMGAEVIRVEAPGGGDIARTNPPFVGAGGINFGAQGKGEVSLTVLNRARNKKSITLDLKKPEGHALLLRLARECARTGLVPFGVYETSDGHAAIAAFQPDWLKGLLEVIGRPELAEDPRFASRGPRMKNAAAMNAIVQEWAIQHTSAEIVHELLEKRGVPCARVRKPDEVLHDPVLHQSGAVMNLQHPSLGDIGAVGMGLPIRFSETHSQFDQPATELGASNDEVYGDILRLGKDEIAGLHATGII